MDLRLSGLRLVCTRCYMGWQCEFGAIYSAFKSHLSVISMIGLGYLSENGNSNPGVGLQTVLSPFWD